MIIRRFLPALPLFLLGAFSPAAADQVEIELDQNASMPVLITPASSIRGKRQLQNCEDYKGKVFYNTPNANGIETSCDEIKKRNWLNRCKRKLDTKKMNFPKKTKVKTICPDACGVCDSGGGGGGTPSPPTRPPPPVGGGNNGKGKWGSVFLMKVIPIHSMLVPGGKNGMVISYGTTNTGTQRADLYYEVWDLDKGVIRGEAHALLRHYTKTDLFCSNLNIDAGRGTVLIMGGDTRNPKNGLGVRSAQEYRPDTKQIVRHPLGQMTFPRWYPTSIILPNGDILVVGGKAEKAKKGASIPELYSSNRGFKPLWGANIPIISQDGSRNHWWYPHMWVNSKGQIVLIMPRTTRGRCYTYVISVNGNGNIKQTGLKPFVAHTRTPSIMFRVDTVLMLDDKGNMWVVDISDGNNLKFKPVNNVGSARTNASMALLPDGRVVIVGGCKSQKDGGNILNQAVKNIQIWDPVSNKLTTGDREIKSRLYHSTALITPFATVVSTGGGAPGPETNLNGQEYFPDYMPNNNQKLDNIMCPKVVRTNNGKFDITVSNSNKIARVTAIKSGSSSHSRNCDARWLEFSFDKNGNTLEIDGVFVKGRKENFSKTVMLPGLYLFFALDWNGMPSKGCLVGVDMNANYL